MQKKKCSRNRTLGQLWFRQETYIFSSLCAGSIIASCAKLRVATKQILRSSPGDDSTGQKTNKSWFGSNSPARLCKNLLPRDGTTRSQRTSKHENCQAKPRMHSLDWSQWVFFMLQMFAHLLSSKENVPTQIFRSNVGVLIEGRNTQSTSAMEIPIHRLRAAKIQIQKF